MKKKLFIVAIVLVVCTVALAAMDSEVKRRAAQGFDQPTADGSIDIFDRAMLTGIYIADSNVAEPAPGMGTSRLNILFHQHHD